jgi:hypothetical protein
MKTFLAGVGSGFLFISLILFAVECAADERSTFQAWVDEATNDLAVSSMTVMETSKLQVYAATDGTRIYVHPLFFQRRAPSRIMQFIAYHEVCHRALGHLEARKVNAFANLVAWERETQFAADQCAINLIRNGQRKQFEWLRWNMAHPLWAKEK